jgi:hypothetical protein
MKEIKEDLKIAILGIWIEISNRSNMSVLLYWVYRFNPISKVLQVIFQILTSVLRQDT